MEILECQGPSEELIAIPIPLACRGLYLLHTTKPPAVTTERSSPASPVGRHPHHTPQRDRAHPIPSQFPDRSQDGDPRALCLSCSVQDGFVAVRLGEWMDK